MFQSTVASQLGDKPTGRQFPQLFMHFVHVLIFVNYRAGLTLSIYDGIDYVISVKVQNVVMFVVMPLSKCQYLLTFHAQDVSFGTVDAGVVVDMTKCATESPETVSSGGILSVLSTNRTI